MRLALLVLLLVAGAALAQAPKLRPATEAEFAGYWRVLLIPNDKHRSPYKNEAMGFAEPCQIVIQLPEGHWFNLAVENAAGAEESRKRCFTRRSQVDAKVAIRNVTSTRWTKIPKAEGLFLVRDLDDKDPQSKAAKVWKADIVLADIPAAEGGGIDLKKGDLLMHLTRRVDDNRIAAVWPMVLRPLQNK